MKADRLALAGSFCWNRGCPGYGKVDHGNIVRYGRTAKGTQRLKCKECLALLAERNSLASIHRVKGIKEETVMDWLRKAANHVEEIEALLLANHHLTRVQLDAMWTYVGHKGEKATIPRNLIEVHSGGVLL
jgi:transposase-like protein